MEEQTALARPLALMSVAAPEDAALLARWESHLRPLEQAHLLSFWSDLHLLAGADRAKAQEQHLQSADVVLLLLSASFFDSRECLGVMEAALSLAQTGSLRVIPLLVRPIAWQDSPLGEFTPMPSNGKPVLQWRDRDQGWLTCVQEMRRILGQSIWKSPPPQSSSKQADADWERMLRRLHRSYKELLSQSLHGNAWVELGLSTRPELVRNATTLLLRLAQGGEQLLPQSTKLVDVYDEAEGELLILGAPGAGKSTLLLDLAVQLVAQAQTSQISLLPVILRLSSWARGRPIFAEWIVEQFAHTYDVPHHLCKRWMQQGRLLPLLDGLDEMEEAARPACIAAINTYHLTHLTPLVVCSRLAEYEAEIARERLALQNAVIVQPLSNEQIEASLCAAGPSLRGVQAALHQKPEFQELATTPLMLSVLLLTYRNASLDDIMRQQGDLERQVWTDYVERMGQEKGNSSRYPLSRIQAWLSFLAQQMHRHQQSVFSAEHLQPDWLPSSLYPLEACLSRHIPSIVIGMCVSLLISIFMLGNIPWIFLFRMGVLGGFVGGYFSSSLAQGLASKRRQRQTQTRRHLRNAVLFGIVLAASNGLSFEYEGGERLLEVVILGLGSLLSAWRFQVLVDRVPGRQRSVLLRPLDLRGCLAMWGNSLIPLHIWQAGTTFAIGIGLSVVLFVVLRSGLSLGLLDGLLDGLFIGLGVGVSVLLVCLILDLSLSIPRFAERLHWTWRILILPQHFLAAVIVAGIAFLFYGLRFGLNLGLSEGLSLGLSYWVVLGLYQGMKQEHLEEQSRCQFNQGIRRSARNGLLISLISAIIMTAMAGLGYGLSNWMDGLDSVLKAVLSLWWNYGLILLVAAIVVIWALTGGLTVLRHYVIRALLARHLFFPWHAVPFLDDATNRILLRRVGGGYSFIHRRLQDHFADTALAPGEEISKERGNIRKHDLCG